MDQRGDRESSWTDAMGSDRSELDVKVEFLSFHDDHSVGDGDGEECCLEG